MCFYYAELSDENICKGVSQLSGKVDKDNMIEIPTYDTSLLGKKYENGEWIEVEPSEPFEPEPTQLDRIEANTTALLGNESALDVLLGVE